MIKSPRDTFTLAGFCSGRITAMTAASHLHALQALLFSVLLAPPAASYSYRNCIENPHDATSFNCIQRFQHSVDNLVADLPRGTVSLNVSHNQISALNPGAFSHLPRLASLRLDYNGLEVIQDGAFEGLGLLRSLNLSFNAIRHLCNGTFDGLHNLTELWLTNNRLATVPPGAFSSLAGLERLYLDSNWLEGFSEIVEEISGLGRLRVLDLCTNRLKSVSYSSHLPWTLADLRLCNNSIVTLDRKPGLFGRIRELDLSGNSNLDENSFRVIDMRNITYFRMRFTKISVLRFLNLSNINRSCVDYSGISFNRTGNLGDLCRNLRYHPIRKLTLQRNKITSILNNEFAECPQFKTLDLSYNSLKKIGCLKFLENKTSLEAVKIEHNLLDSLNSCSGAPAFPNLVNVTYRYNRILTVRDHAFGYAPGLRWLQLNINNIAYLGKHALTNLTQLLELRLDNNLITDLFYSSFQDLESLQTLNLRNNRISVIFNQTFHNLAKLRILDLGGNKITHFTPMAFAGLRNLTNLYLDRNNIKSVFGEVFRLVRQTLKILDLQGNMIRFIKNSTRVSPFVKLTMLQDLKLQGQRPYGITIVPHTFFRGLGSLRSLYLSGNGITVLPEDTFDDLVNLEFLSLDNSGMGINNLRPGIFKSLGKLRNLNLENMGVQSLSREVFRNLTGLQTLVLNRNALPSLDEEVILSLTSLRYLDLRGCPLTCTCHNTWLQNWSSTNQKVQVVYFQNLSCPDRPGYLYNFDTKVCYLDFGMYLFASTCPAVILLTILPMLYVKLYWRFRYSYYIFRSWFNDRWRRADDEDQRYKYDAFISYNSADEGWVLQELLPNLELRGPPSFKLCLHHRDFELGRNIVDNIVDSIYCSRKTLCVVSRQFLLSEWCSLEIQLASYRLFHELRDVLILVFLERIPERELSAYHKMRKVMLKKTYIEWPRDPEGQGLFWTKLKEALRSSNLSDSNTV
ncbi:toll-like receptor 13 [Acipenser ruthenus]|uniref:toll-like receptor 13 n=1 Tax=Acipenser ruthenus TaxID=7906 RepID=UPI0027410FFA|nr:toll-like receptor 13 [Acipenser ruthenus]